MQDELKTLSIPFREKNGSLVDNVFLIPGSARV